MKQILHRHYNTLFSQFKADYISSPSLIQIHPFYKTIKRYYPGGDKGGWFKKFTRPVSKPPTMPKTTRPPTDPNPASGNQAKTPIPNHPSINNTPKKKLQDPFVSIRDKYKNVPSSQKKRYELFSSVKNITPNPSTSAADLTTQAQHPPPNVPDYAIPDTPSTVTTLPAQSSTSSISAPKPALAPPIHTIKENAPTFTEELYFKANTIIEKRIKTAGWTPEKEEHLKEVTAFDDRYIKPLYNVITPKTSRDLEEYHKLFSFGNQAQDSLEEQIKNYLAKEPLGMTYTQQDIKQEMERHKEGQKILDASGNDIRESVAMEMFRRAGVIKNKDACYTEGNSNKNHMQPDGEGFMLDKLAFEILSNKEHPIYRQFECEPLTKEQHLEIKNNIDNKYYSVATYYNDNPSKLVESSEEVHMNLVTYYHDMLGNPIPVSPGCLTSSKDNGTISLQTTQKHINTGVGDREQNKEQRFRTYSQYVNFNQGTLKPHKKGTEYVLNTAVEENDRVVNVAHIISKAIADKENDLKTNSPRGPYIFLRNILCQLAIDFHQKEINDLNYKLQKMETHMKSLDTYKRKQQENKLAGKAAKHLKDKHEMAYQKGLPKDARDILEYKKDLETQKAAFEEKEKKTTNPKNDHEPNKKYI